MPGKDIDNILVAFSSNRAESAWKKFLESYSPTIMQVVCHHEGDKSRADECFLFVCEKLSDNGFRRLLQFDASRKAHFRTWLKLVVSNICVDWHRKAYGRQRPYRAIAKLSAFDRLVHHYNTECSMNRSACFHALQLTYPDLTEDQFTESMSRLHNTLTSRQRWQLSVRKRVTGSTNSFDACSDHPTATELVGTGPDPATVVQLLQTREALLKAMARLTRQQRALLRLRYQEELSLKDVADLAGLGDLHRAKRQIKKALTALAELLNADLTTD